MDYIIEDGELYHAGVKGMRWGHRKARATKGANNRKKSKKTKKPLTKEDIAAKRQKGVNITNGVVAGTGLSLGVASAVGVTALGIFVGSWFKLGYDILTGSL